MTTTPTSWDYPRWQEPPRQRFVRQDHSNIDFRILRPTAATPKTLVFTRFSEPFFNKTTKIEQQSSVSFKSVSPPAATPGILEFSVFSTPSKTFQRNSDVSASFFTVPVAVNIPPVFTEFSKPIKTYYRTIDSSFVNYQVPITFIGVISTDYVFKKSIITDGVINTPNTVTVPVQPTFIGFLPFGLPPRVIQQLRCDSFANYIGTQQPSHIQQDVGGKTPKWQVPKRNLRPIKVDSSTLKTVLFDETTNELGIYFKTGRVYTYKGVEDKKVSRLGKAKSSGKFFHNKIKNQYPTTRLK